MKDENIRKFYNEICDSLEGDYKIILEPNRDLTEDWIEYDKVKWELDESIQKLVEELKNDDKLDLEEKILSVYKHICLNYIYDDNVLYFFKRDTSDLDNIKYIAVDWYGRIVGKQWLENRKQHNRRVCYEFARFYAKAINDLLREEDKLEACMIGDKENLHYFVGLTGEKYSVLLDLDDFNKIKDLTRLKLGLTINGITLLRDDSGKFQKAIDRFNQNRLNDLVEVEEAKEKLKGKDTIQYFNRVIEILRQYDIDSQGFQEYMRTIVEGEEIEVDKVWKEDKGGKEKRYIRCLTFDYNNKPYLIDSIEKKLIVISKEELDKESFVITPEENEYLYYGA